MDLLKLIFNQKPDNIDSYEEVGYEGDIRAILISQKLEYEMEEQENI